MPKTGGVCTTKGGVTARVRLAVETFLTKLVPGQYPSLTATRKVQEVVPAAVLLTVNRVEASVGVANCTVQGEADGTVQE